MNSHDIASAPEMKIAPTTMMIGATVSRVATPMARKAIRSVWYRDKLMCLGLCQESNRSARLRARNNTAEAVKLTTRLIMNSASPMEKST